MRPQVRKTVRPKNKVSTTKVTKKVEVDKTDEVIEKYYIIMLI